MIEIVSHGGLSRLYLDGVEQLSKLGAFTPADLAPFQPRAVEPLRIHPDPPQWRTQ